MLSSLVAIFALVGVGSTFTYLGARMDILLYRVRCKDWPRSREEDEILQLKEKIEQIREENMALQMLAEREREKAAAAQNELHSFIKELAVRTLS